MDLARLKFPLLVTGIGLLLGFIADLLTYSQPLGMSVPIIAALVLNALIGLAVLQRTGIRTANLWLIVPLLLLAAFSAIRAEPLLRLLNVLGTLLLLILLANRLSAPAVTDLNVPGYAIALIEGMVFSALMPFRLLPKAATEARKVDTAGAQPVKRVFVGLLIALPFLLVFTGLFASADLVFGQAVERIFSSVSMPSIFGHTFMTLLLSWITTGGLAYALARTEKGPRYLIEATGPLPDNVMAREDTQAQQASKPQPSLRGMLGALEASVALFSVDGLFLVFVAIQFAALFGGEAFLRSQGLTYSEYARRGFFELLTVALIILSLILAADHLTRRESPRAELAFLIGTGLMILLTIIILISAFLRMQLYEQAYGFTRLRVNTHIFMVWLAIVLAVLLGLLIIQRMRLFATVAFAAGLCFVMTLNLLNPDAFIVRRNLARAARGEGVPLDVPYLGSLSEDAIPLLVPLLEDPAAAGEIGPWLRWHLIRLDRRQADAGWPAAHWSINRAYRALDAHRAEIEQYNSSQGRYYRQSW